MPTPELVRTSDTSELRRPADRLNLYEHRYTPTAISFNIVVWVRFQGVGVSTGASLYPPGLTTPFVYSLYTAYMPFVVK